MAQVTSHIHAFNAGEMSAAAQARIDQEKLRLGADIQENLLPYVVGKAIMRPGTQYLGASKSNNQARGIPFVRSIAAPAAIELTNGYMRVWVNDALVTRAAVTSTVTNGDFSSATGWTLTTTGDAVADINSTVSGALYMSTSSTGSTAYCERSVTTSSAGTEHALRIVVTRGPVRFLCGSSSGTDDYITETTLDTGIHSLSFTPSGTYYVRFFVQSTPATIVDSITVEAAGVMEIAAPWVTAELLQIKYALSIDVMFLAHTNWQPRKIERRNSTSWSLALYHADDGPFTTDRTALTRLKCSNTFGNVTVTSERNFFTADHVGALFRQTHTRMDANFKLAGEEQYTQSWKTRGIGSDHEFSVTRSGTWVGTLVLQRSYLGPTVGFQDTGTSWTSNGSTTGLGTGTSYDNQDIWYRIGFKTSGYTSGTAALLVTYSGYSKSGVVRITDYSSPTSVSGEVLEPFANTFFTEDWQEGEWSDVRGWPSAVAFHEGRLWFGRDDRPAGSVSDNYYSYATELVDSSGNFSVTSNASIQRDITTSGSVPHMNWMLSLGRLIFGTDASEISARADALDAPLTPTTITMKDATTIGSNDVTPVKFDKRGFFVNRAGDKLFQLIYSFEQQDYDSKDMTELNEDIGSGGLANGYTLQEIAVARHPQPHILVVRSDGTLLTLLFSIEHNVYAWTKQILDGASGEVESVYVLPSENNHDRVYVWVKRTINGSTVRYLEKFSLHSEAIGQTVTKLADAGVYTAGPVSSVTAAHLASETGLVGWGTKSGTKYVLTGLSANGSGVISLGDTYSSVWVGLPYTGRYRSSKLAYGSGPTSTALLQKKEIQQIGLLLQNTHRDAIQVGPTFSQLDNYILKADTGQALADADAVKSLNDDNMLPFGGKWDTDSRACIKVKSGYPATLLGLVMSVATNVK